MSMSLRGTWTRRAVLLIVRERDEAARGLPSRPHEIPLVIQDRRAGSGNQFIYTRTMMDGMSGILGNRVLVNGRPDAAFRVPPRPYRLRIANVSNARIYKLAWSDGRPLTVIATDNGLLSTAEGAQTRPYVTLAPFERVELLEDFGQRRAGVEIALISRAFSLETGMSMPRPMHVHGVRFRVIERDRASSARSDLAEGIIDTGFKDTVLVFPGERVRLLLTPTEPGLFLYHCHNLEHEDGGMMRNYLVS